MARIARAIMAKAPTSALLAPIGKGGFDTVCLLVMVCLEEVLAAGFVTSSLAGVHALYRVCARVSRPAPCCAAYMATSQSGSLA